MRGTDFHLDLLGGSLTDQQIVFPFQVIHDSFVHLISGHAHGTRVNDAAQRNHRNVRCAAANVDHHVAAGLGDGQSGADRRYHGLLDQMHFAGLGAIGRIHDRAFFHLRNLRRDTNHDARMHQHLAVVRLLNEIVQHLLGDLEIGNHAVFHGLNGDDVAGRAAQHFLRFFANSFHFARVLVDGDDGRLIHHDALAPGVYQGVRRSQVDSQVAGENAEQRPQVVPARCAGIKSVF